MKFRKLILLDFKLLTRNKLFYLKLLLFPLVLIAILGLVFNQSSDVKIAQFSVAYFNSDNPSKVSASDSLGSTFEEEALKNSTVKSTIRVVEVSDENQAKKLLKEGKAAVYIRISKDFTDRYFDGQSTQIQVDTENASSVQKEMINSIVQTFIENVVLQKNLSTAIVNEGTALHANADMIQQALFRMNTGTTQVNLSIKSPNGNIQSISSMQYYAVAMTLMFSILTALTLIHSMVDDKLNGTFMRIESMPLSRGIFIFGKLLSISLSVFLQMAILIIFTSLVYQAHWGDPWLVFLTTALYSITVGALALLLGLIAKSQTSVSSYSSLLLWGASFLGGSFVKLDNIGGALEMIHRLIPNGAALEAYIGIANGNGIQNIGKNLMHIGLFAIIFLTLCLISQIKKGDVLAHVHPAKSAA